MDLYEQKSKNFDYLYFLLLNQTLETYARFLRIEIPPPSKILKYFDNPLFRKEYKYKEFPDKKFQTLFLF